MHTVFLPLGFEGTLRIQVPPWKESTVRVINTVPIWMLHTEQGTNGVIPMAQREWPHPLAVVDGDVA